MAATTSTSSSSSSSSPTASRSEDNCGRHNLNLFLIQLLQPNSLVLRGRKLNEPGGTIVSRVEEEQDPVFDIKECKQACAVVGQQGVRLEPWWQVLVLGHHLVLLDPGPSRFIFGREGI